MSHRISQSQYKPPVSDRSPDRKDCAETAVEKTDERTASQSQKHSQGQKHSQAQKQRVPPDALDAREDTAVSNHDRLQENEKRTMDPGVPSAGES